MIRHCCEAGDEKQPDHLPLPLQPQLCPRTPGPRRRTSSGAIRWHTRYHLDGNFMWKVFAMVTSCLFSSYLLSSPIRGTDRSAGCWLTGGPTLPNMGRIYNIRRVWSFRRNPSPDTGLWQPWDKNGQYLEIGAPISSNNSYTYFSRQQSTHGTVFKHGEQNGVLEVNLWQG